DVGRLHLVGEEEVGVLVVVFGDAEEGAERGEVEADEQFLAYESVAGVLLVPLEHALDLVFSPQFHDALRMGTALRLRAPRGVGRGGSGVCGGGGGGGGAVAAVDVAELDGRAVAVAVGEEQGGPVGQADAAGGGGVPDG